VIDLGTQYGFKQCLICRPIDGGGQSAAMTCELVNLLVSNELHCPNFPDGILKKAEHGNYYQLVDYPTMSEDTWEMKAFGRLMLYMLVVHRRLPTCIDPVVFRYFLKLPFDSNIVGEYSPMMHNVIKRISKFPNQSGNNYLIDRDLQFILNEWKYQVRLVKKYANQLKSIDLS